MLSCHSTGGRIHSHDAASARPIAHLNSARVARTRSVKLIGRRAYNAGLLTALAVSEVIAAPSSTAVGYTYGTFSAQGLREDMEDRLVVFPHTEGDNTFLYAGIYDGHGGFPAAEWMKGELHGHVTEAAKSGVTTDNLSKAFVETDKKLLKFLEEQGGEVQASSGSTCTVSLIESGRVVTANVGDTSCYILRANVPIDLTTPHRVYGKGKDVTSEVERVRAAGGWIYDGRVCNILAVSRAFGDWEFKGAGLQQLLREGVKNDLWTEKYAAMQSFTADPVIVTPDTSDVAITAEDEFLVMSTDGLWDVVPSAEVMRWAKKQFVSGMTPAEVAQSLVELALRRKTTDNVACLVVDFKGAGYWAAQKPSRPEWLEMLIALFNKLYYGK